MKFKEIFCKHEYEKIGTLRCGGFLHKGRRISCGQTYITSRCMKCKKTIQVRDKQDSQLHSTTEEKKE